MTFDRREALERLASEHFDVLVVGGGITGAGVALDAASRGLTTALVERDDFASGTSSKSSKLIHGGLRYLQQREFRLVYENLAERQIACRNAPHLVRVLPFLLPIMGKRGVINPRLARTLGAALWMYDITGGARLGRLHKRISKETALTHMPVLPPDRLADSYLYYDAQTDDARLTLGIVRTAAAHGAAVANRVRVTGFVGSEDITGAQVEADGSTFDVRARRVVNASGVWSDELRALDEGADPRSIRPAKGIHLTVPWSKIRNDIAVIIPVPKDRRSIFVVPWGDLTYIGTTDTEYDGPIDDPRCDPDDISYLLDAINASSTEKITEADVVGTWAGLRPLLADATNERTADLSRRHAVRVSDRGLVTVTGGKLTTYRRMAQDTVDMIVKLDRRRARCRTKRVPLVGGRDFEVPPAGSEPSVHAHLTSRYGTEAGEIQMILDTDTRLGEPLVPGLPYLRAEATWAVRAEMATTLDDVLSRRTRARLLARDASAAAAEDVARLIAPMLGWSRDDLIREVRSYRDSIAAERESAELPETALDASLGA